MKKQCCLVIFLLIITNTLFAQELLWKVGVRSFFDNSEFGHSNVQIPQSMSGVHVAPEIGVGWAKKHRVLVGVDLLHEYGSNKAIDFHDIIAYYEYAGSPFHFYMGAIPRDLVLSKYPRMFFQDSIRYYRPTINGLFWELSKNGNYANVWLDWTSRQTNERDENFFMGWSGRYNLGILYAQHFGYMFHFAGKMNPLPDEDHPLHDNGLLLTSLGVDLAHKTGFEKLDLNVGWSIGMEKSRGEDISHKPQGFLSELNVEYRGLGLFNTYYKGEGQQLFYPQYNNKLYWGDPFYRTDEYNRLDLYVNFIKNKVVEIKLTFSFHMTENTTYNQQALYATFNLDNFRNKKDDRKYKYLWDSWF
jgi:hypothetical protein